MPSREKGSAVIVVVLVVLVLTMVGLAALIFMSLEQNLTLSDRLSKEALYISEAGLRQGETVVSNTILAQMNTLLGSATPPAHSDVPPTLLDCEGTQHLGAVLVDPGTGAPYYQFTPGYYTAPAGYYAVYTLYLRNNPDDPSGSPTNEQDNRVRLVCSGEVYQGGDPANGGVLVARKILEEELSTGVLTGYSGQKGGSSVGAGSSYYR